MNAMVRVGKCDCCRLRKVKCNEQRPQCGACIKSDRTCTYTYGRASAFVLENPTQFSTYGKNKVAPLVYPLEGGKRGATSKQRRSEPDTSENSLDSHQSSSKHWKVSEPSTQFFNRFISFSYNSLDVARPWSAEDALRARFVTILESHLQSHSPFVMDGLWAGRVPSRIGRNRALDLALHSAMDSFDYYKDSNRSSRETAILSRGRALRALRVELERASLGFDIAQAIKMHFYSEVFLNFTNWSSHHLHLRGLFAMLKAGEATISTDQDFWVFLHSTYVDEVVEAIYRGTHSKFDTEAYRVATSPDPKHQGLPSLHTASMTIMHCWIQIPRLLCLVRKARSCPSSSNVTPAISLASELWDSIRATELEAYFAAPTNSTALPDGLPVADIINSALHSGSVNTLMLLTHYCVFLVYLCGLTQTLHKCFPTQAASLPAINTVIQVDTEAALCIARAFIYALSDGACVTPPLLLFRMLGPLQTSTGSWLHSLIHNSPPDERDVSMTEVYSRAEPSSREIRMIDWIVEETRRVAKQWQFPIMDLGQLEKAQEFVSGGVEWHGLDLISSKCSSEEWPKRAWFN